MYALHYAPDNASMILRLTLEELAVPYRTHLIDRSVQAQRSPAYLALNPNGLIPALETPHGVIFETGAALRWLADTHRALAPGPNDPRRGDFLKWLFFCSNTLHASLRCLFYPAQYAGPDAAAQSAVQAQTKANIARHFRTLDTHYRPENAPQVIDFYIAACLRWSAIYGPPDRDWFDLDAYPVLRDMAARLELRESVKAAAVAEGLGANPFTAPQLPNPPEGSAT